MTEESYLCHNSQEAEGKRETEKEKERSFQVMSQVTCFEWGHLLTEHSAASLLGSESMDEYSTCSTRSPSRSLPQCQESLWGALELICNIWTGVRRMVVLSHAAIRVIDE